MLVPLTLLLFVSCYYGHYLQIRVESYCAILATVMLSHSAQKQGMHFPDGFNTSSTIQSI